MKTITNYVPRKKSYIACNFRAAVERPVILQDFYTSLALCASQQDFELSRLGVSGHYLCL